MVEIADNHEHRVRSAAFQFLAQRCPDPDDTVAWSDLQTGLVVDGQSVVLIGAKGIWRPKGFELPLSIATAPPKPGRPAPYDDHVTDGGLLAYRYRGTDPAHTDNVGLRRCLTQQVPLIYFHGVLKGLYLPAWPVFVVADNPEALTFTVAVDDPAVLRPDLSSEIVDEAQRRYHTARVRVRLHQATFRERVLAAYRRTCAICSLKQAELLEAAHIVRDIDPGGEPIVPNGLSLCRIHHAAYDRNIIGIRPDHIVEVRADVLSASDGPMLLHGLQEFHGAVILSPRSPADRPDPQRLEQRYEEFRTAAA